MPEPTQSPTAVQPKTDTYWMERGYFYLRGGKCRGKTCGAEIQWWHNSAQNKWIPLDPGTLVHHSESCPDADSFSKKGRK